MASVHHENLAAGSNSNHANRVRSEWLYSLRKNAQIVIPQAAFARGICFFFNTRARSRFLSRLRGIGITPAPLFPQTVQLLKFRVRGSHTHAFAVRASHQITA